MPKPPPVASLALAMFAAFGAGAVDAQSLSPLTAAPLGMAPLPVPALIRPVHTFGLARAQTPVMRLASLPATATPGQQCRQAIRAAERAAGIPEQLMAAIGRIESGRREADGSVNPWPWSINVAGVDHVFDTKAEAVAAVHTLQAQGVRSVDVGCMQVNLMYHPDAFASLEEAFDPVANATYAARFLLQLHEQTGAWPTATAWYHSATPELGEDYRRKVMAVWPEEKKQPADNPRVDLAAAWGATRPPGEGVFTPLAAGAAAPASGFPAVGNRAGAARVLPLAPGATPGRGLAAYRAVPIPLAARPLPPIITTVSNRG